MFEMAWSRAFQKCIFYHFLDNFFCKHFYSGFCNKKINFCKLAIFFADSKTIAQELSNDVSFVIFGHQTWDLAYPGFQVPQVNKALEVVQPFKIKLKIQSLNRL